MRLYNYLFGKKPVAQVGGNEETLLLPLASNAPANHLRHQADKKEERGATISAMHTLVPADLGEMIYALLDSTSIEGAQGRISFAKQYSNCLDIDEAYLETQTAAHEVFLKGQKSIENVLSYLFKHHRTLLGNDLQFRYVKLGALTLSNPLPDAEGVYTVDLTGADYAALKDCFKDEMDSSAPYIFWTAGSTAIALLFGLLFVFMKRNLEFCYFMPGASFHSAPADLGCETVTLYCGDLSPAPDICSGENTYCPQASFLNSAWVLLDPDNIGGLAMSCSYTNQAGFVVGICLFSLIALISADLYYSHRSSTTAVPDVLRDNWKNVQRFFAKPKADFTVTPLKIDPNAVADRIEVVCRVATPH